MNLFTKYLMAMAASGSMISSKASREYTGNWSYNFKNNPHLQRYRQLLKKERQAA